MAKSRAHSDDQLTPMVKESNTGHAESAAKKAPLPAKQSELLGGEQTSDGLAAEARVGKTRNNGNAITSKTPPSTGANQVNPSKQKTDPTVHS